MAKLYFHFTDWHTLESLPSVEVEISSGIPGVDEFIVNTFLESVGRKSMEPIMGNNDKLLSLAFITTEDGKKLFYNAHNF